MNASNEMNGSGVNDRPRIEALREGLSESETFASYKLQILWKRTEFLHLLSGSFFELPGHYVLQNLTDTDRMRVYPNIQALPRDAKLSDDSLIRVLFIDAQTSPVGFCRLHYPNENKLHTRSRRTLHGPARKMLLSDWLDAGCKISHGATELFEIAKLTLDQVDAIFCPYWASEATDWMTRISISGWPDKKLKDHIVRGGCHLVAKSHHTEPDDSTQWRYSFSQAEIILINSWNDVQKYIYHILRIVKGRVTKKCKRQEKSIFNNYLFKTLMLWACEKKTEDFWNEDCIESSIAELLCQAIECLIDKECQHYFIPKVNILDHSLEIDIGNEISSLEEQIGGLQRIMSLFSKCDATTGMQVDLCQNFVIHYKLQANAQFVINPFSLSFERYFDSELENDPLFHTEVETLLKGILTNLKLRSSKSMIRRIDDEETVIECFRACVEENPYNQFGAVLNSSESFHSVANRLFNVGRCFLHVVTPESDHAPCKSSDVDSSKEAMFLPISPLETNNLSAISTVRSCLSATIIKPTTHRGSSCCVLRTSGDRKYNPTNRNFGTHSSFLNLMSTKLTDLYEKPCHLISKAYYANYHYAYHKNYEFALHFCHETLEYLENAHNCSGLQTRMQEDIFPVIFSRYWMPLFDENIQVVFAFLILIVVVRDSEGIPLTSLFWVPPLSKKFQKSYSVTLDSVIEPSPRGLGTVQRRKRYEDLISSVIVQVSAVELIRYIGVQCRKHLRLGKDSLFDIHARYPSERRLVNQSFLLLVAASLETPNRTL